MFTLPNLAIISKELTRTCEGKEGSMAEAAMGYHFTRPIRQDCLSQGKEGAWNREGLLVSLVRHVRKIYNTPVTPSGGRTTPLLRVCGPIPTLRVAYMAFDAWIPRINSPQSTPSA